MSLTSYHETLYNKSFRNYKVVKKEIFRNYKQLKIIKLSIFMEQKENTTDKEDLPLSVKQDQIHNLLFSRELGWQEIIYDLINTEQLDPWDVEISVLTEAYLKKIQELEEADYFVSSKVLLAASLLLRIKSEILLNKFIKSIDEILFGKKDQKKYETERIELDEEIPELIPRSPIPRLRRVTLTELIESLNKAITTENRRIKKEIINRNALRETEISLPKRRFSIKDKIKEVYEKIFGHLGNEDKYKVSFTDLIGTNREERIIAFSPLLHLENQKKIWLAQDAHFEEIHIWLKKVYLKHNPDPFADLKAELEKEMKEWETDDEKKQRLQDVEEEFSEPLGEVE